MGLAPFSFLFFSSPRQCERAEEYRQTSRATIFALDQVASEHGILRQPTTVEQRITHVALSALPFKDPQ